MKLPVGAVRPTIARAPPDDRLATDGEWIVCLGATRSVVDGRVACPLRHRAPPLAACLECHLLTWHSDERDRAAECSTDAAAQAPNQTRSRLDR